jgi:hypothetical protein
LAESKSKIYAIKRNYMKCFTKVKFIPNPLKNKSESHSKWYQKMSHRVKLLSWGCNNYDTIWRKKTFWSKLNKLTLYPTPHINSHSISMN